MLSQLRPTIVMLLVLTVITGLVYPLAVTLIAQIVFPHQADGSLVMRDGKVIGSELIGQGFVGPVLNRDDFRDQEPLEKRVSRSRRVALIPIGGCRKNKTGPVRSLSAGPAEATAKIESSISIQNDTLIFTGSDNRYAHGHAQLSRTLGDRDANTGVQLPQRQHAIPPAFTHL